jgi:methyltransferase (TIGR00027 family)
VAAPSGVNADTGMSAHGDVDAHTGVSPRGGVTARGASAGGVTAGGASARGASRTAEINAAMRAGEAYVPAEKRLFDDPFAHYFVQRPSYRAISSTPTVARMALRIFDRLYGGLHAEIILRNRYYEQQLLAMHAGDVRQLVLLGAGYDSIALRQMLPGLTIFEVDAPATQRIKRAILTRHNDLHPRTQVAYVECDFEHNDLREALTLGGFRSELPCLVVWLGVSYYLSNAAVNDTLRRIATLSAPGSCLIWDYMDRSVIDRTTPYAGARRAAAAVAKRGEPYIFGLEPEPLAQLCTQAGFAIEDHVRIPDLARTLGPPAGVWCSTDDYMGVVRLRRT